MATQFPLGKAIPIVIFATIIVYNIKQRIYFPIPIFHAITVMVCHVWCVPGLFFEHVCISMHILIKWIKVESGEFQHGVVRGQYVLLYSK